MPLPDRPVAAASIETEWGQAIHDYTFAPSGCRCTGGAVSVTSTTPVVLPIDTATEDPGGFVDTAGNRVVVPTDGEGFYDISIRANTVTGATTSFTRMYLLVNGANQGQTTVDGEGGTNVPLVMSMKRTLAAGDIVTATAIKLGTGTSPSVSITELTLVRLGAQLGA